ncbi:MAG: TPM domain-containing protein [Chitinophagaceae bacterium]
MMNRQYFFTKGLKQFFLLLLLALPFCSNAADGDFPAQPNPPALVNDFAHFLSDQERATLEQKLRNYHDSTSTEIAIVTLQSIGQYDISDYTVQLFNKWHVGGKEHDNGILILVAKEQRKIWITTGYGMEGALPDGLLGQIIRREMEPNFKRGDYFIAFDKASDAIILAARGEYKADPSDEDQGRKAKGGPGTAVILLIVVIIIIAASRRGGGGGGGGLLNSAGWIAASMLSNRHRSSGWGGGWGGGSSGGGGGFGGFGGGSSGGGGAGGGW